MKKKQKNNSDVVAMIGQIQGQLAVMDQKLDSFMTKSLTELAQALAASKPVVRPLVHAPQLVRPTYNSQRPMYAVICYECGKDSELPFKPSGNRPVYCRECFARRKNRSALVNRINPSAVDHPTQSIQQTAPASKPPAKAKRKNAANKPVKRKKKVAIRSSAKKKPVGKKKKVAKKKTTAKKKTKARRNTKK